MLATENYVRRVLKTHPDLLQVPVPIDIIASDVEGNYDIVEYYFSRFPVHVSVDERNISIYPIESE